VVQKFYDIFYGRAKWLIPCALFALVCGAFALSDGLSRQREANEGALGSARAEVNRLQLNVAQLEQRVQELHRPSRFYFDEAVNEMQSDKSQDTADADRRAISQFQVFIDHFPGDALSDSASQRINELEKRMADRDITVRRAQTEVLRLIKSCDENHAMIRKIGANMRVFNDANRIDWNSVSASDAATRPYEREAEKAKDAANLLLPSVPDPDGSLAKKVENCGLPEDLQ
jgi:hypothetical protein